MCTQGQCANCSFGDEDLYSVVFTTESDVDMDDDNKNDSVEEDECDHMEEESSLMADQLLEDSGDALSLSIGSAANPQVGFYNPWMYLTTSLHRFFLGLMLNSCMFLTPYL